jgi:hypothetical protein
VSARRRFRTVLTGAAVAVAAFALVPQAASANNFGNPPGCCYWADNSNQTWYPWSLTTGSLNALRYAMGTRLESTVMTTDEFQSQDANTDVVAVDVEYGTDPSHYWWGLWTCDTLVSGSSILCNKGTLRLNLSWGTPTTAVTCHEVGHSVGLDHSTDADSCMQAVAGTANDYNAHDRSHIDGFYL